LAAIHMVCPKWRAKTMDASRTNCCVDAANN
jgi:hypothetical protein